MDNDFALSPDTQAVLLLCSAFGRSDRALASLTLAQYNVFAKALADLQKRPADLLELDEALIEEVCNRPSSNKRVSMPDKERIFALLRRGMLLAMAVDKWASYGVHVISRADKHYPQRLREHLKDKAPPILYYAGNKQLFEGGGLAIVGARDLNVEAEEAIRKIVRECVSLEIPIVSGGARGADQTAMQEAFECGGNVIGALPCELLKACLDSSNRHALANGNALLFSDYDPELKPFSYGTVAMNRNKYIYAMSDKCFVAQSGISTTKKKSGTFEGAIEELKRPTHRPVYVFLGNPSSDGCLELLKHGALKWESGKSLTTNVVASVPYAPPPGPEDMLLPGFLAAEHPTEYTKKRSC